MCCGGVKHVWQIYQRSHTLTDKPQELKDPQLQTLTVPAPTSHRPRRKEHLHQGGVRSFNVFLTLMPLQDLQSKTRSDHRRSLESCCFRSPPGCVLIWGVNTTRDIPLPVLLQPNTNPHTPSQPHPTTPNNVSATQPAAGKPQSGGQDQIWPWSERKERRGCFYISLRK